jgi:hypothetical protein
MSTKSWPTSGQRDESILASAPPPSRRPSTSTRTCTYIHCTTHARVAKRGTKQPTTAASCIHACRCRSGVPYVHGIDHTPTGSAIHPGGLVVPIGIHDDRRIHRSRPSMCVEAEGQPDREFWAPLSRAMEERGFSDRDRAASGRAGVTVPRRPRVGVTLTGGAPSICFRPAVLPLAMACRDRSGGLTPECQIPRVLPIATSALASVWATPAARLP